MAMLSRKGFSVLFILLIVAIVGAALWFVSQHNVPREVDSEATVADIRATDVASEVTVAENQTKLRPLAELTRYLTDEHFIYFDGNDRAEVQDLVRLDADAKSFVILRELINASYAKDRSSFFYGSSKSPIADGSTFEPLMLMTKDGYPLFFKDKENIYRLNDSVLEIIPNGDPATYHEFPSLQGAYNFAADDNQFYCYGAVNLEIDPKTAVVRASTTASGYPTSYVEDKNGVYIAKIDVQTGDKNCVKDSK